MTWGFGVAILALVLFNYMECYTESKRRHYIIEYIKYDGSVSTHCLNTSVDWSFYLRADGSVDAVNSETKECFSATRNVKRIQSITKLNGWRKETEEEKSSSE